MAKSQTFNEDIYPNDFDDDDKFNFDNLLAQTTLIYPNCENWIMKLAIIAHINREKGQAIPLNREESLKLREKYLSNVKGVYETPKREILEDENNILSNE
jgi:hypothetical protein